MNATTAQTASPALPSTSAVVAQLLSPAQRACLQSAAGGVLHRTRQGYSTATRRTPGTYHQPRSVFALVNENLLACVDPGDTTSLRITQAGRDVLKALA